MGHTQVRSSILDENNRAIARVDIGWYGKPVDDARWPREELFFIPDTFFRLW